MRRLLLVRLLLPSILSMAMLAPQADAQKKAETPKNYFMRLTNPEDLQRYGPGANCVVSGLLQLPELERDVRLLIVRMRVYRPDKQGFIIDNEAASMVKKLATGGHLYKFEATLRLPKDAGKYLLRLDCLDLKVDEYPQSLIATQSLFILVETRAKPEAKGHSVKIGTPKVDDQYGTGANISVLGSSDNKKVVTMRLRFLDSNFKIIQETTVDVMAGAGWSGTLSPPTGGWPTGNAAIQAQGLDSNGSPISGEAAVVTIIIK